MKAALSFLILVCTNLAYAVDVQVPGEIRDPGAVQLVGTPGTKQKDGYRLCFLSRDKSGQLMNSGQNSCTDHKIAEEVHVPAGTYIVHYSGTRAIVEVKDQTVQVNLLMLQVPRVDGTYSFYLYRDTMVLEEQTKAYEDRWTGANSDLRVSSETCDKSYQRVLDSAGKALCSILTGSKSPNDYKSVMKFDKNGAVFSKSLESSDKMTADNDWIYTAKYSENPTARYFIISGQDGDSVAVLPGTFAATFVSSAGHQTYQANIVVK